MVKPKQAASRGGGGGGRGGDGEVEGEEEEEEEEEVSTAPPSFNPGGGGGPLMTFAPTSSPTSAPTESTNRGGGGGPDACTPQQMACMSDETCAACMTGATLDGSCVDDAVDCAGVASYYCCVAGEGCSDNALLLDFVSKCNVFSKPLAASLQSTMSSH